MKISVGEFLLRRLRALGIERIYGVPGDYNLQFMEQIERQSAVAFIGCCNELNAAYAADGAARISGVSALAVTYGVGDLGALSGIAGAYAENVPLVLLSAAPPLKAIRGKALMHHTCADGNYDNVRNCFREFTAAQAMLTPENAVAEFERALRICLYESKPVYVQIPADVFGREIEIDDDFAPIRPFKSDAAQLDAASAALSAALKKAKKPVMLIDALAQRQKLAEPLTCLIEKLNMPFIILSSARGAVSESHPCFSGTYRGKKSPKAVYDLVNEADCIIGIGAQFTDVTSCWFSNPAALESMIQISLSEVQTRGEFFAGVSIQDLLGRLLAADLPRGGGGFPKTEISLPVVAGGSGGKKWNQDNFWRRISDFVAANDVLIADSGTGSIGIQSLKFPDKCSFIHQPLWAAIGYALPALLGAALSAPERRRILFIGDGAFQMTAQELSTIIRHDLKPIIFLINNEGYGIERPILGEHSSYNDIAPWRYAEFPSVLAAAGGQVKSFSVKTMDGLEAVLAGIEEQPDSLIFVEAQFSKTDYPQGLDSFGAIVRSYNSRPWLRYE